jgi:hypothetical protein
VSKLTRFLLSTFVDTSRHALRHFSTSSTSPFFFCDAIQHVTAIRELSGFGRPTALVIASEESAMFKLSIVESHGKRTLVLEGKLVEPWTAELERAWRGAGEELEGRKLVIDLRNLTLISQDGENTLLKLMKDGAKFSCCGGVFTRHVLKQLARRCRRNVEAEPAAKPETLAHESTVQLPNLNRGATGGLK